MRPHRARSALTLASLFALGAFHCDAPAREAIAAPVTIDAAPPVSTSTAAAPGSRTSGVGTDELARLEALARTPATEVQLAPSPLGVFGAWLVAGPFRASKPAIETAPAGLDETKLSPALGASLSADREAASARRKGAASWLLASSNDGPIDLKAALDAGSGSDVIAYAGGVLHVARAGRYLLLLGVDDGVRVTVDGQVVFTRDESRPLRTDDDIVPLDLGVGEHPIVLKFHQRDGAWAFRARFVDEHLAPPIGAYLRLPGTTPEDAQALATKMSFVAVDRTFDTGAEPPLYRPKLTVRFTEGAPRGIPIGVRARLTSTPSGPAVFDVPAGGVPVGASGVFDRIVALPPFAPSNTAASLDITVAGRTVHSTVPSRPLTERALAQADRVLAKVNPKASWLVAGSLDSVVFLTQRLAGLLARGDGDAEAQADEARELERLIAALERGVDPYEGRTGPMRRAIRSDIDGEPSEFGLYLPRWYKPDGPRKFPLVVGLHGLNGHAMGMMRWLFGGDDPKHDQGWEDRHVGTLPPADAIVVTPFAHGNTLYRELGETDVMHIVDWAMKTYAIDPTRVTITGPSMGGIGSASIPLHLPHVFAAAQPLCGYHSYLIRRDVAGHPIRPWERFLAEERSNALWAENGEHLPLWIVHGTQDLPEENSGVLIDRYEKLHFSIKHEHPDKGHNVWQETYEELRGMNWLLARRLDPHPAHVHFKTTRTRWSKSAWLGIDELSSEATWGEVDARIRHKNRIVATTHGVSALTFTRDAKLIDATVPLEIEIDGKSLSFTESEAVVLHKDGDLAANGWSKGPAAHTAGTLYKHGTVTGPLRDVFYGPLVFVYGDAPDEARANEQVARTFAKIRGGVRVAYPIMSDTEFFANGEPLANDRALFLVGRTNRVRDALERISPFPIHVDAGAVSVGNERITGRELGAAFIRPNPARPERYVVVLAGSDVPGTLRALSLPDLLPDFVVWDAALAPSRGAVLLGAGSLRAGGLFTKDWALPASVHDPLSKSAPLSAPTATTEHEATPYLP